MCAAATAGELLLWLARDLIHAAPPTAWAGWPVDSRGTATTHVSAAEAENFAAAAVRAALVDAALTHQSRKPNRNLTTDPSRSNIAVVDVSQFVPQSA